MRKCFVFPAILLMVIRRMHSSLRKWFCVRALWRIGFAEWAARKQPYCREDTIVRGDRRGLRKIAPLNAIIGAFTQARDRGLLRTGQAGTFLNSLSRMRWHDIKKCTQVEPIEGNATRLTPEIFILTRRVCRSGNSWRWTDKQGRIQELPDFWEVSTSFELRHSYFDCFLTGSSIISMWHWTIFVTRRVN